MHRQGCPHDGHGPQLLRPQLGQRRDGVAPVAANLPHALVEHGLEATRRAGFEAQHRRIAAGLAGVTHQDEGRG